MTDQNAKSDVYSRITDKIIADLERGNLTWRKPWHANHLADRVNRPLRWNNQPYSGVNIIMLWSEATDKEYASPYWMTFQQANELGGHVRKGEKATPVVYANKVTKEETNSEGETEQKRIPFLKQYWVFNANQIEGLPDLYSRRPEEPKAQNPEDRIPALEHFFAQTKAEILHQGNEACYNILTDKVKMPPFETFVDAPAYYSTLGHEITHWTRHPKRLNRDFGRKKFGDEGYAQEELVAEIASCFLAADLGIEPELREDHSAYIENWLQVLKGDKRFIFTAASHASKAVEYLHSLQK